MASDTKATPQYHIRTFLCRIAQMVQLRERPSPDDRPNIRLLLYKLNGKISFFRLKQFAYLADLSSRYAANKW